MREHPEFDIDTVFVFIGKDREDSNYNIVAPGRRVWPIVMPRTIVSPDEPIVDDEEKISKMSGSTVRNIILQNEDAGTKENAIQILLNYYNYKGLQLLNKSELSQLYDMVVKGMIEGNMFISAKKSKAKSTRSRKKMSAGRSRKYKPKRVHFKIL